MALFELPIKHSYVPQWGLWEGVREIIQNGLDEEDQRKHVLDISYSASKKTLTVTNIGASMDRKVLLLGHTTKAEDSALRGQFGEGLNLAMLALVRSGHPLILRVPGESWTALLEDSDVYGEKVLKVRTRVAPKTVQEVSIDIQNISPEEWLSLKYRFLPLNEYNKVSGGWHGDLLTDARYSSQIFVKGIYVMSYPGAGGYGFDLKNVQTDRDRGMVEAWMLEYSLRAILAGAADTDPDIAKAVFDMLKSANSSTDRFDASTGSTSFREAMKKQFVETYGENAFPVISTGQAKEATELGATGVVVPAALAKVLEATLGDMATFKEKQGKSVVATYSWSDLSAEEQAVFAKATSLVSTAVVELGLQSIGGVADRVTIVDFGAPLLDGLSYLQSGKIEIARRCLQSLRSFLTTLIHEEAHIISQAEDGERHHVRTIEAMWGELYELASSAGT